MKENKHSMDAVESIGDGCLQVIFGGFLLVGILSWIILAIKAIN